MVEREAQLEQEPTLDDAARESRVARVAADRAEQDRVVLGERVEVGLVEDAPGGEVVPRAERVLGCRDIHPRRGKDFAGFGDDLGADSVAGDDCERERTGHALTIGHPWQRAISRWR